MEYYHYLVAAAACLMAIMLRAYYFDEKKKLIRKIPGPPAYPLVGNAWQFKSDPAEFYKQLLEMMSHHPGIGVLWLGNSPRVLLYSSSTVEVLLSSSSQINKSSDYDFSHDWIGLGLLTSTGEKWKERRRLLTPTFHFDILQSFLPVFNRHADTLVEKLRIAAGNSSTVDVFPLVTRSTLDIICETAMGTNLDVQNEGHLYYLDAVYRATCLLTERRFKPWLWNTTAYDLLPQGREYRKVLKVLHDFTNSVIDERRAELSTEGQADHGKRMAFLDQLLHLEPAMSRDDIREEVDTFMFGGHDTTAAALGWCIHTIGSHPQVQQRIHDELQSIFGESGRDVDQNDLRKMSYLECAIKETLRIFPPAALFGRRLSENAIIGGYTVPAGTGVLVFTSLLHRDPNVFPNPETFDPDRFSPENSSTRNLYAYVPFSAGMRNCIGQKFAMTELKVVLASIFRNFTVEAAQKTEDMHPVSDVILRPSKGVIVKLSPHRLG